MTSNNKNNELFSDGGQEHCLSSENATSEVVNVNSYVGFEFDQVPFVEYIMHLFCEVNEEKQQCIANSRLEHQNQEQLECLQEKESSWTEEILSEFVNNNNSNNCNSSCSQSNGDKNIKREEYHKNNREVHTNANFLVKKRLLLERYYIDHYNSLSASKGTSLEVPESAATSPSAIAGNTTTTAEAAGKPPIGEEITNTHVVSNSEIKGNIKNGKNNSRESNNNRMSHSVTSSEHNSTDNLETPDKDLTKPIITLQQRLRVCLLCALGYIDTECKLCKTLSLNWNNNRNVDECNGDKNAPTLHSTNIDQKEWSKEIQVIDNTCKCAIYMPPSQRESISFQEIQALNLASSDADIYLSRKVYLPTANTIETVKGDKETCRHDCKLNDDDIPCLYFELHQDELCASAVCEWFEDVLEFITTSKFSVEQACCVLTCARELLYYIQRIASENSVYEAKDNVEENICAFLKRTLHTYTVEVQKTVTEMCHKQEEVQREMPDPNVVAKLKARLAKNKLSKKQIAALEEELKHIPVISCTVVEDKVVEVPRQITVGPFFHSIKEVESIYEFLRNATVNCWRLLHYMLRSNSSRSEIACEQREECRKQQRREEEKVQKEFLDRQELTHYKYCKESASNICENSIHREVEVVEPFCVVSLCTFLPENLLLMEHERQELLTSFTQGLLAIYEKEFLAEWEVIAHEERTANAALVQKINANLRENKALAMSKDEYLQTQHALLMRLETKIEKNKVIDEKEMYNRRDVQSMFSSNNNDVHTNNNKKCLQEKSTSMKHMNKTNTATPAVIAMTDANKHHTKVLPKVDKLKGEKVKTLPVKANPSTNKTLLPRVLQASAPSSLEAELPQTFCITNMFSKKADYVNATDGPCEFAAQEFNLSNVLSRLATIEERCDQIELSASASKSTSGLDMRRKKEDLM